MTEDLAVMFADVKGFSRLEPEAAALKMGVLFGWLAQQLDGHEVRYRNSWGDAIVVAMEDHRALLGVALRLRNRVHQHDLGLRVALDCGLVRVVANEVIGRYDVFGDAVNRAARMEPIAPVGSVIMSRAFRERLGDKRQVFHGFSKLPKGYAQHPLPMWRSSRTAAVERLQGGTQRAEWLVTHLEGLLFDDEQRDRAVKVWNIASVFASPPARAFDDESNRWLALEHALKFRLSTLRGDETRLFEIISPLEPGGTLPGHLRDSLRRLVHLMDCHELPSYHPVVDLTGRIHVDGKVSNLHVLVPYELALFSEKPAGAPLGWQVSRVFRSRQAELHKGRFDALWEELNQGRSSADARVEARRRLTTLLDRTPG